MSDTDNSAEAEPVEAAEEDAPEAQAEDNADDTEAEDVEADDTDEDAEEAEPEFATVEFDGVEYEVPAALKDGVLMRGDYTQKTQSLAAERKQFEAQAAHMQRSAQLREAQFQDAAGIHAMDQQLAQYDQVDWMGLADADPVEAQKLSLQRDALRQQRDQANAALVQKTEELSIGQREYAAKEGARVRSELKAKHPDWTDDLEESMAQYAIGKGVPEGQIRTTMDMASLEILRDAHSWHQHQAKLAAKTARKATAQPAKPAAKVKGSRQGARKSPDDMSVEEWRKWRENQIAKRNAA
jgi:hypothetical protein